MDEERRRKRKLSNRESARRSRTRKRERADELAAQVGQVEEDNKRVQQMIDSATEMYVNFASENNVLRAQLAELTDRLRSLNSVIQIADVAFDVLDIPPWQLPCPILQPIPASADM